MVVIAPVRLHRPGSLRAVQRLRALPSPALAGVATGLGLVLGGLSSFAQTVLPDALESSANSASGWTLLAVLIVALMKAGPGWSALFGAIGFSGLTLGYQVVSTMRGYPTSETFFLVTGLIVGPFVGLATAWLRRRDWRPALAAALLAGIGIGEGVYGLTVIASSTSPVYWSVLVLGSIALLAAVVVRRADRWWHRLLAPVGAVLVAAAFLVAYGAPWVGSDLF